EIATTMSRTHTANTNLHNFSLHAALPIFQAGVLPAERWQTMKLSRYEQETIILYTQAEATAEVYTHDPRLLEKLRRLAEKYPDQIVKKDRQTFLVPKRCVSVREPYSAERRKAASELAKAAGYRPPTPKKGNE